MIPKRSAPLLLALGLGLALLGLGVWCRARAGEARAWPAGTVLAVGERPILAAEVDAIAAALESAEPRYAEPMRRRLALTKVLFPLVAGELEAPRERERARARAVERMALLQAGQEPEGEPGLELEGNWLELGITLWLGLAALEPGQSALHEVPGAFVLLRLLDRDRNPQRPLERFRLRALEFPYAVDRAGLDERVFDYHLEIVDPQYRRLVPLLWQHRMPGGSR